MVAHVGARLAQRWLELGGDDFERVGVDELLEVTSGVRLGHGEEAVVEAHLGVHGVRGADPMNGAFDLAPGVRPTGTTVQIGGAAEFNHGAGPVFDDFIALDDAGVFEAHLAAGTEAEIFRRRDFAEVVLFNEQLAGEGHLARAGGRILGIVHGVELDDFAGCEVGEDELERAQDGKATERAFVQVFADGMLEHGNIGEAVVFRDADVVGERAQRLGRDAAATDAADRGHARVVPAGDEFFGDELHELALAHHRVAKAEAGELELVREGTRKVERFENPVVERAMHLELKRADAVRDALEVVAQTVREIVHRIDAPRRAGVVMLGVADAVEHGIAQPDIRRGHVDLRAQGARAIGEFSRFHAREEVEILGHAAFPERRILAGTVGGPAEFLGVLRRKIAHISLAEPDQFHGELVNLREIVGGVEGLEGSRG